MKKTINHHVYIIVSVILACLIIALFAKSCFTNKEIQANINPLEVQKGVPISFADSTKGAQKWLWEFGNGDSSIEKNGEYIYPQSGKYQVRLTVNDKFEKKIIVVVKEKEKQKESHLIQIIAPETAIEGEYIVFKGEGDSKEWSWQFGETGKVDSREKTPIYQYSEPGIYEILLETEDTYYPISHFIEIFSQYVDDDSSDVESLVGNEIREKLQAIVDQKPFNQNYNYILYNYLCNNPNTLVMVNNTKKNDFYSYCQGLKIIGKNKTKIENVLIEVDENEENSCINKLIIIQSEIQ